MAGVIEIFRTMKLAAGEFVEDRLPFRGESFSRPLRVGLIGAGKAGTYHAEVISAISGAELAFVVSRRGENAKNLAARYGVPRTGTDLEAYDNSDVDACIVAVPPEAAVGVAGVFLRKGIPCLVEKPPGMSSGEAEELRRAAKEVNTICAMAFNRRTYGAVLTAFAEAIRPDAELYAIHVEAPEDVTWRRKVKGEDTAALSKRFITNIIHAVDLMTMFAGEAEMVKTCEPALPFVKDEFRQDFTAMVKFKNGIAGTFVSHWHSPGRWKLELFLRNRRLIIDLDRNTIEMAGTPPFGLRSRRTNKYDRKFKPGVYQQNFEFLNAVAGGFPVKGPLANIDDGILSMRLAESIACERK